MALHCWPQLRLLCDTRDKTLHLLLPGPGRRAALQVWIVRWRRDDACMCVYLSLCLLHLLCAVCPCCGAASALTTNQARRIARRNEEKTFSSFLPCTRPSQTDARTGSSAPCVVCCAVMQAAPAHPHTRTRAAALRCVAACCVSSLCLHMSFHFCLSTCPCATLGPTHTPTMHRPLRECCVWPPACSTDPHTGSYFGVVRTRNGF